jgi:hypothetical protein
MSMSSGTLTAAEALREQRAAEMLGMARYAARGLRSRYPSGMDYLHLIVAALELAWAQAHQTVERDAAIAHAVRAAGLSDTTIDAMKADFAAAWRPDLTAIPGGKATNGNA